MSETYFTKHLKEEEVVVALVRSTPLAFFWSGLLAALFILGAFFLLYPLFRFGPWGVGGFLVLLLTGGFLALRIGVLWYYNVFLVTNARIIDFDQQGLVARTVSECAHGKVQDVSYRMRGALQTAFHFGDVIVQTASQDTNLEITNVKQPKELVSLITELQQQTDTSGPLSADELIRFLERVRSSDPKTFRRLIGDTSHRKVEEPPRRDDTALHD